MSLTDHGVRVKRDADVDPQIRTQTRWGRARTRGLRALGLAVAFVATVALAAGVVVVGPNVEEWHGVLPTLDESGYPDDTDAQAADVFGWSAQQGTDTKQADAGAATAATHAFLAPEKGTLTWPGHWCSAEPVGYRLDLTGAKLAGLNPGQERRRWKAALSRWTAASGDRYSFDYRGEANFPLTKNTSKRDMNIREELIPAGEIAITYATSQKTAGKEWDAYRHRGLDTAYAFGGIGSVRWSLGSPDSGLITTGSVVIDANDVAELTQSLPTVYVHEAGHALGLAHVDDPSQMMFKNASQAAKISSGDREGIRTLATSGCPGQP